MKRWFCYLFRHWETTTQVGQKKKKERGKSRDGKENTG